jgi:hypothetical protein
VNDSLRGPSVCKLLATDPVGAEARADLELAAGADELRLRPHAVRRDDRLARLSASLTSLLLPRGEGEGQPQSCAWDESQNFRHDAGRFCSREERRSSSSVALLGREWHGILDEQVDAADLYVEVPMIRQGASLNVALAGNLVLYRSAGMA